MIHMKTVVQLVREKNHTVDGGRKSFLAKAQRGFFLLLGHKVLVRELLQLLLQRRRFMSAEETHTHRTIKTNKVKVVPSEPRT